MNPLLASALVIFVFMCLMFLIALWLKNNGVADVGWGVGFMLVAWLTFFWFGNDRMHQKIVTFLVTIWGLRLTLYLAVRNWGEPEDFRYANWRKEWGGSVVWRSFLQVFMLQGFFMFINLLPVIVVNSSEEFYKSYKWLYPLGAAVWCIGFFFEAIGDKQMYEFKCSAKKHPHKKVMNKGLWRYTRHPNYFGEAAMWWGIFILSIPSGMWYVSVLSPLVITYLLLKVSGVTLLEKKYEGNDEYSVYKRTTSAFFPMPPKQI
ncbi:MAG: DUF1295 domain-containing protein [Chitinophagales bacterium]|nr:DUF1295 domain-containing protein [Chitinophagales bacterium]